MDKPKDHLHQATVENTLLREIEWLRTDYARLVSSTEEDELLQKCYAEQAIEHFKFVLAYFDAKYDKF